MSFKDLIKGTLDAERLQKSAKATVQNSGRLAFTADATEIMGLNEHKGIIVFETNGADLGATITTSDDPKAFAVRRSGVYYYLSFKNYLQQKGIDYIHQRVIYDITVLDEKMDDRTLYKFTQRLIPQEGEKKPRKTRKDKGLSFEERGEKMEEPVVDQAQSNAENPTV